MRTAVPALAVVMAIVALIAIATALSIPIVAYNNPTFAHTTVVIWYQNPTIAHKSSFIAAPVGISAYIGTGTAGRDPESNEPRDDRCGIALFDRLSDNIPKPMVLRWDELVDLLRRHDIRQDKDGRLFSPTQYAVGARRGNEGVLALTAFVGDVDDGWPLNRAESVLGRGGWAFVIYTTHSHTAEKPKFRIVVPFLTPVPVVEWGRVWQQLNELVEGHLDPGTKDPARISFLPSHLPGAPSEVRVGQGRPLDVSALSPLVDIEAVCAKLEALPLGAEAAEIARRLQDGRITTDGWPGDANDWFVQMLVDAGLTPREVERFHRHADPVRHTSDWAARAKRISKTRDGKPIKTFHLRRATLERSPFFRSIAEEVRKRGVVPAVKEPGSERSSAPGLEEFDPETGDVFLAAADHGREEIGIVWVTGGEIHRTTVGAELKRIDREYEGKTDKDDLKEKARAVARLLRSLPFTRPRDAIWPLAGDPLGTSVAEWERAHGPLLDRIVRYYAERTVFALGDGPMVAALWSMAAAVRSASVDYAPRLLLEAPFGWGKSTTAEAIQVAVPRGVHGAVLTPASVHRMMNEFHPVLVVDESSVADNPELQRVIRAGFKRGVLIVRAAQNRDTGVTATDPFGFVILTTQVDAPEDVVSRCWVLRLRPGSPVRRVSRRDPEAAEIRTLLLRLRLDVLAGTQYADMGAVAERAHARDGLEPRSRDKLTALWPFAVRYGVEDRLVAAAAAAEEEASEQLASGDKGIVVAALDDLVREAGGPDRVKAGTLAVSEVHHRVEEILLTMGEATTVGAGENARTQVDPHKYSVRDFTARHLRGLGLRIRTTHGRSFLDRDPFIALWPVVRARYLGTVGTLDSPAFQGTPGSTPPIPPQKPDLTSVGASSTDPTPTPPSSHPDPTPPTETRGGMGGVGWDVRPTSSSPTETREIDSERDRRVAEAVDTLKRQLADNSAGYGEQTLRDRLGSMAYSPTEVDGALGRLYGEGSVVRSGDRVRLKGAAP